MTEIILKPTETRRCNKCGEILPLCEFVKDKQKPAGRGYTCNNCRKSEAKNRRHKTKERIKEHRQQMMCSEAFTLYYRQKYLRDQVSMIARRFSKRNKEFQKDLKQMAWARIAMNPAGMSIDYYLQEAFRAIEAEYKKQKNKREYSLEFVETLTREEHNAYSKGYF